MLTGLAAFLGGILFTILVLLTANTHAAQRLAPALGRLRFVKDRGYRVFSLLLDGPSEARVKLAEDCRTFAKDVRSTLAEPPMFTGRLLERPLFRPEVQQAMRYFLRHLADSQVLLGRAAEQGAISSHLVPTVNKPFPVALDEVPDFLDETARRLGTNLRLRKISRVLGHEIPASTPFVYLDV